MKQKVYKDYSGNVIPVKNLKVVETYQPSGTNSLELELEDGRTVRILEPFFDDMQKNDFER